MVLSDDQRRLLGTFLRSHRERLALADVGLDERRADRRRTPGLRREEVARICGLSPTWYSWIEQGRDISVSAAALARLAEALRLTPAERIYLFELARSRDPAAPPSAEAADEAARAFGPLLESVAGPAYLLDGLWRVRAWNAPAAHLFADWFAGDLCLLAYVFLDPGARRLIPDWEDRARRLAAEYRADTAGNPDDRELKALTARLLAASPDFSAFWKDHAVLTREGGSRVFVHPIDGELHYTQTTLTPSAWSTHKLVVLVGVERPADPPRPPAPPLRAFGDNGSTASDRS